MLNLIGATGMAPGRFALNISRRSLPTSVSDWGARNFIFLPVISFYQRKNQREFSTLNYCQNAINNLIDWFFFFFLAIDRLFVKENEIVLRIKFSYKMLKKKRV